VRADGRANGVLLELKLQVASEHFRRAKGPRGRWVDERGRGTA
jgi:hypothetical protein